MDYRNANLQELICMVRQLADSQENTTILQRWQDVGTDVSVTGGASVWHGVPTRTVTATSTIPFTVDPETVYYAKALGYQLRDHYLDPVAFLENTLRMKLLRYDLFGDDAYITKDVALFMGVVLEPSMFGVPPLYQKDRDPWNEHVHVIHTPEDIEKLQQPDFFQSGIMPLCHRFYREIRDLLPEDFTVAFPLWGRGPWGLAQHMMGLENLYMSALEEPEFVEALLCKLTSFQKKWLRDRADFLGIDLPVGAMYNDEVNGNMVSPAIYEELIFPREQELAQFQNGISYWHSCGNTAPFLKHLKTMHRLEMYDCSAWTDWETVARELQGTDIAIEVRMHPIRDVLLADESHIRATLNRVRDVFGGMRVTVRADGFQVARNLEDDTRKIQEFSRIAAEMLR